jgi:hypothetical protein
MQETSAFGYNLVIAAAGRSLPDCCFWPGRTGLYAGPTITANISIDKFGWFG